MSTENNASRLEITFSIFILQLTRLKKKVLKKFQNWFDIDNKLHTCVHVYPWMILTSRTKNSKRMNKHSKNECINTELKIKIDDRMNK